MKFDDIGNPVEAELKIQLRQRVHSYCMLWISLQVSLATSSAAWGYLMLTSFHILFLC